MKKGRRLFGEQHLAKSYAKVMVLSYHDLEGIESKPSWC
jgi:hypothetical protein